jgi:two-component system, chemotaxis family, chemotaxis protein CheY
MKALVVDDSRAMRLILTRALEPLGFSVCEAVDGEDALEQVRAGLVPVLVLVDWNMPKVSGIEVVRALADHPARSAMRVVMVTTETEVERVQEALGTGADEYLMKPFTKEAVAEKLGVLGLVL